VRELADQIIDIYERHAVQWDAARRSQPLVEAGWLEQLLQLLPGGAAVLDLGCGTGTPIATYFVQRGVDVVGVDSSETMISLFRRRLPGVAACLSDMRTLRLECEFQGIIAWDSFFHLTPDDQRRMFAVFRRHSAPDALLMFTSGPERGEVTGKLGADLLYHASLSAAEYRTLLSGNGYRVIAHVAEDAGCSGHTVWLAQRRP